MIQAIATESQVAKIIAYLATDKGRADKRRLMARYHYEPDSPRRAIAEIVLYQLASRRGGYWREIEYEVIEDCTDRVIMATLDRERVPA